VQGGQTDQGEDVCATPVHTSVRSYAIRAALGLGEAEDRGAI